jgi:hypothetical protein
MSVGYWNGSEAVVPTMGGDGAMKGEPVYRVRVRGTEDLELAYEIVQPDGNADTLSVGLRRGIGLVRLSGDDRNDRDLRRVQGSALDRLLSAKALRSRLASELAKSDVTEQLTDPAKEALKALDLVFKTKSLPDGLDLALTGGRACPSRRSSDSPPTGMVCSCHWQAGDRGPDGLPPLRLPSRIREKLPSRLSMKSYAALSPTGSVS